MSYKLWITKLLSCQWIVVLSFAMVCICSMHRIYPVLRYGEVGLGRENYMPLPLLLVVFRKFLQITQVQS